MDEAGSTWTRAATTRAATRGGRQLPEDPPRRWCFSTRERERRCCSPGPRRVIACHEVSDVAAALAEAEAAARAGFHVAGYLAYEAGFAFEEKLRPLAPSDPTLPLVRLAVFDAPERLSLGEGLARIGAGDIAQEGCGRTDARVDGFELTREAYDAAFAAVREHLARGDIYQANLTMRARGQIAGDPARLFARLLLSQPVGHAAFLRTDTRTVLSAVAGSSSWSGAARASPRGR